MWFASFGLLLLVCFFRLNYSRLWLHVVKFLYSNSSGQVRSGSDVSRLFHLSNRVENYFMFITMGADYFSLSIRFSAKDLYTRCDILGQSTSDM